MSGIEVGLLIASAVGTGTQVAGQLMSASSSASAARANAHMKNMQADELLARQGINEGIMREESDKSLHVYAAKASMGEGAGGGGIGGMLQIKSELERNITLSRRDAEFKAKMLRMGAEVDMDIASDAMTAGWLGGATTILGSGAKFYDRFKSSGNQDLWSESTASEINSRETTTSDSMQSARQWKTGRSPVPSSEWYNKDKK